MLRQKGKRRKPVETRGRFNVELSRLSIAIRPSEVCKRETFEFFPKESDFATMGQGKIVNAFAKNNGRSYKFLGWNTEYEGFTEEVLRLI